MQTKSNGSLVYSPVSNQPIRVFSADELSRIGKPNLAPLSVSSLTELIERLPAYHQIFSSSFKAVSDGYFNFTPKGMERTLLETPEEKIVIFEGEPAQKYGKYIDNIRSATPEQKKCMKEWYTERTLKRAVLLGCRDSTYEASYYFNANGWHVLEGKAQHPYLFEDVTPDSVMKEISDSVGYGFKFTLCLGMLKFQDFAKSRGWDNVNLDNGPGSLREYVKLTKARQKVFVRARGENRLHSIEQLVESVRKSRRAKPLKVLN